MLKLNTDINKIFSFTNNAIIKWEEECYIHYTARILGHLKIGAFSYIGYNCLIGSAVVGRFCSIAPGVVIGLGEHDTSLLSTHPIFYGSKHGYKIPDGIGCPRTFIPPPPIIGDDVWIGANAIIRRGVIVGKGAVIAANSVVTKDVPSYHIVGGMPAKIIKIRFEQSIVNKLKELDWTSLNLSCFINCDVSINNIDELIKKIELLLKDKNNLAKYKIGIIKKINNVLYT